MQVKLLIFALLWSLTLSCKSSPSGPTIPKDNCEYCPECARVSTGLIGGASEIATIRDVSTGCPNNFFLSTQIDKFFLVPMDGEFWVLQKWQVGPLLWRCRHI